MKMDREFYLVGERCLTTEESLKIIAQHFKPPEIDITERMQELVRKPPFRLRCMAAWRAFVDPVPLLRKETA